MRHINPDARDYKITEKLIAGLVLSGSDVKSLRTQTTPLAGSKVEIIAGYPKLLNIHIPKYKFSQISDDSGERNLLLKNSEIERLLSARKQKYMLIPLAIFPHGRWFKLEIGIGRKMTKYDKREKIKARDLREKGLENY